MKYHTTTINIIASLAILFIVVVLVLVLNGMAMMPNLGNTIANTILQEASGSGLNSVSVGSVETSLFKRIIIHNLSIEDENQGTLVHVDKLEIDVPAYRFLWEGLYPKQIPITVDGIDFQADRESLSGFQTGDGEVTGDGPLSSLLTDRTISISVINGTASYGQEDLSIDLGIFDSIATIVDGNLTQARLDTDTFTFSSPQLIARGADTTITLGRTATGAVGLRLDAENSSFSSPEIGVESHLDTWRASFIADSMENLLEFKGSAAMTLQSVNATMLLQGKPMELVFDSIGADAEISGDTFPSISASFPSVKASYDDWEGQILALDALIDPQEEDDLAIVFDSSQLLRITHNSGVSMDVQQPEATISFSKDFSSFQINIGSLRFMEVGKLAALLGVEYDAIEKATLEEAYVLALVDRSDGSLKAESSFDIALETSIPFLESTTGQISGSIALDEKTTVQSSQVFIRNLESRALEGELDANLLYDANQNQEPELSLDATHSNGIQLSMDHMLRESLSRISLRLDNMSPRLFQPLLEKLSPTVSALIAAETSLEGNINFILSNDLTEGRGTAELGVANLAVDEQRFNLATTFTGNLTPTLLNVDLATLTTEGYRLSYTGSIERTRIAPEGTLNINDVESGDIIVTADFERTADQKYEYRITTPVFVDSDFTGNVSWAGEGAVNAQGLLSVPEATYPVSIEFEQEKGLVTLVSDNLTASLDFVSVPGHITFDLETRDLPLPPSRGNPFHGQGIINGTLAADFSLAEELFLISSSRLEIQGLAWKEDQPFSFSFSIDADSQEIRFQEVEYTDQKGRLSGYANIRNQSLIDLGSGNFDHFHAIVDLSSEQERITLSFFPDEDDGSISRGTISIEDFDLGRFAIFPDDTRLQFSFVGATDIKKLAQGHASIELGNDIGGSDFRSDLHLEDWGILFNNTLYRKNDLTLTVPEARFAYGGETLLDAEFVILSPLVWRDGSTRAKISLSAELPQSASLFEWLKRIPTSLDAIPPLQIEHSDVNLLGAIPWSDGTHLLRVEDRILSIEKGEDGTIEGSFDFESGRIDIKTISGFPVPVHAQGTIKDNSMYMELNDIEFNLEYLNMIFLEPIITFEKSMATGSLIIDGPVNDPDYYGTLLANSVDVSTFWTPGELFSLKNPVITVSENLATIAASPVSAVHTSGRRTTGTIQMEFTFEKWHLPHYRIDILEIKDPISLWVPLAPPVDVNVSTMVAGSFSIDGTPTEETLYGDITVSEGLISFGVDDLPSWFNPKTRTSIDMTIRTGRNVSFIFPNEEAPILRATFADDQVVGITVEAPAMATSFSGELAFRSGEIYYVQKNFYITEGSLRFPSTGTGLDEEFMPRINLRARLREFEADGTRVDIYMVLQEARFDDLNPRFESIPLRSTNEILELLGQNIVAASTARDSGLTSVVAVASAATDVISRLGLLQNTTVSLGFSSIIRESLGLDVFTIRTNLLQNILFEALPGVSADTTVSPIARYLDNTTMYLGKYLLEDFYLQGMLHFRQDARGNSISFLANDLRIDTELSVEWTNPLATFSFFTQPDELSVFDLFDTMGFSITKRFEF